MSRQWYVDRKFVPSSLEIIATMNTIVEEYVEQGFRLTIRQLYYQLVARGHIENTEKSYKRICSIANDARLAGVMDWEAIEDRTRSFSRRSRWSGGAEVLKSAAHSFHMDMWADQDWRVFVIVEKEALAGVLDGVCHKWDMPLLAARGYPSVSVLREFAIHDLLPALGYDRKFQRLDGTKEKGFKQKFKILHLGDHDPSGIDMSDDLAKRLGLFCGMSDRLPNVFFDRIALNMPQIEEQKPPENPAKTTDARYDKYKERFGESSWELDALSPDYLAKLVERHTKHHIDMPAWRLRQAEIETIRERITKVAEDFQ